MNGVSHKLKTYFDDKRITPYKPTFFGILSGVINVAIFNPFDRALNLATKNHTSIFLPDYWKLRTMYQGIHHGIIQRTISYGLWYPAVNRVKQYFDKIGHNNYVNNDVLASMCTSGLIGLATSPVSATKQQYWNTDQTREIFKFVKEMYKKGGLYAFVRGTIVTIKRDMLFGLIFGYLSFTHNKEKKIFWIDATFATFATTVSSPFNYIRVMKYKTECNVHTSSITILRNLIKNVQQECPKNLINQIIYTFHHKFNVGWGSARVGCGMALSRQLYEYFSSYY